MASKQRNFSAGSGIGIGAAIGVAIGVAMHNLPLGIAIGIGIGIAIGGGAEVANRKRHADSSAGDDKPGTNSTTSS